MLFEKKTETKSTGDGLEEAMLTIKYGESVRGQENRLAENIKKMKEKYGKCISKITYDGLLDQNHKRFETLINTFSINISDDILEKIIDNNQVTDKLSISSFDIWVNLVNACGKIHQLLWSYGNWNEDKFYEILTNSFEN